MPKTNMTKFETAVVILIAAFLIFLTFAAIAQALK